MKFTKQPILFLSLFMCLFGAAQAQDDIGKKLSQLAKDNAPNYLGSLLSSLGADMNSGFYHSADLHDVLGFDIGVKVGATFLKDEDKVFDFVMPDQITDPETGITFSVQNGDYDKIIKGSPTAVGAKKGIDVKAKRGIFVGQTIFTTLPGYDLKYAPLLAPQAAIGLPLGLEVIVRFVPTVTLPEDAGKVNSFGFGLRHDIDQYIPLFPLDVAVHFMTQKLTVSDNADKKILSSSAIAYGVEISKSFALLTLYGGFQLEKSSWDIETYDYIKENTVVKIPGFSVEGKNKSRFHAGLRFLLAFINIHADYSFAKHPVAAAGVGISFR